VEEGRSHRLLYTALALLTFPLCLVSIVVGFAFMITIVLMPLGLWIAYMGSLPFVACIAKIVQGGHVNGA
jgi:hypothetical protein